MDTLTYPSSVWPDLDFDPLEKLMETEARAFVPLQDAEAYVEEALADAAETGIAAKVVANDNAAREVQMAFFRWILCMITPPCISCE